MRLFEIADAAEQMALWRLVNTSVWAAIEQQQQQQAKQRAATAKSATKSPKTKKATAAPSVPVVAAVPATSAKKNIPPVQVKTQSKAAPAKSTATAAAQKPFVAAEPPVAPVAASRAGANATQDDEMLKKYLQKMQRKAHTTGLSTGDSAV